MGRRTGDHQQPHGTDRRDPRPGGDEAAGPRRIHTDSQYVQKGISEWIHGWKRNGWKTSDKKPVKNADLWQELDVLAARHRIDWLWSRATPATRATRRADALANRGIDEIQGKSS